MAKGIYVGVNSVARKVKNVYVGVSSTARKVKKVYVGVNGVARLSYSGEINYTIDYDMYNATNSIAKNGGGRYLISSFGINSNYILCYNNGSTGFFRFDASTGTNTTIGNTVSYLPTDNVKMCPIYNDKCIVTTHSNSVPKFGYFNTSGTHTGMTLPSSAIVSITGLTGLTPPFYNNTVYQIGARISYGMSNGLTYYCNINHAYMISNLDASNNYGSGQLGEFLTNTRSTYGGSRVRHYITLTSMSSWTSHEYGSYSESRSGASWTCMNNYGSMADFVLNSSSGWFCLTTSLTKTDLSNISGTSFWVFPLRNYYGLTSSLETSTGYMVDNSYTTSSIYIQNQSVTAHQAYTKDYMVCGFGLNVNKLIRYRLKPIS